MTTCLWTPRYRWSYDVRTVAKARHSGRAVFGAHLVALAVLTLASLASAEQVQTDNGLLREGLELYEQLEYERSVETLSAALLEPGNDRSEQIAIFRTLGTLFVLLERSQEAEAALTRLLCVAPHFDFDEFTSPRIRTVFDAVGERFRTSPPDCGNGPGPTGTGPAQRVTLDHDSPSTARPGEALELRVSVIEGAERVEQIMLRYRATGELGFNETPASAIAEGIYEAAVPSDVVSEPRIEYFFEAQGSEGHVLDTLGTASAPLRVPVEIAAGPARRSVWRSWWLWTVIGVAVAGAAAVTVWAVLANRDTDEPDPNPPEDAILNISICDPEFGLCQ